MTYDTLVHVSQIGALALFVLIFAAVVVYAFWPGNRAKFERAARMPLEPDMDKDRRGGRA